MRGQTIRKMMRLQKQAVAVMTIVLMMFACQVRAANYTWIGPATGETWSSASNNWNAASTPIWDGANGRTNSATFNTAGLVAAVSGDVYASNITVSASAVITNSGGGTVRLTTGGGVLATAAITSYAPLAGTNLTVTFNSNSGGLTLGPSNALAGTLTLGGTANSYAKLTVSGSNSLGSASVKVTGGGPVLVLDTSATITNDMTLTGMGGNSGWGQIAAGPTALYNPTLTGTITLQANARVTSSYSSTLTLNGSIVQTNAYGVEFTSRSSYGTFVLGGSNSFTGGITIRCFNSNIVTVKLNSTNALNGMAGSENAVTFVTTGGTLQSRLTLNGQTVVVSQLNCGPATNGIVQNASATPATLTVGNGKNLDSSFAGILQDGAGGGALSLTKAGTGTLTLSNTNTYSGVTTVNAGTLVMTNAVSSTNWVVATNATLSVSGAVALGGKTLTIATGATTAGLLSVSGNLTLGGSLTVTAGSEVLTAVKIAECTGTVNGNVGDMAATLPAQTYLEKRAGDTQLWLVPKPKGTLIRVF